MAEKNYYDILGITTEEKKLSGDDFEKVVKEKFRNLAKQYHPDKYASKTEEERKYAENKMKEINEAYETLSDSTKRKQYDNPNPFGDNGNPFGGNPFMGGAFDVFENFFGGGYKAKKSKKGSNIRIKLNLTIDDILTKIKKKVKYTRKEPTGKKCSSCNGTGFVSFNIHGMNMTNTCQDCNGTGLEMRSVQHECEFAINGVDSSVDVNYNQANNTVSFIQIIEGEGNVISSDKKENGDLQVVVTFKLPTGMRMETPTDIGIDLDVPVLTAIVGGDVEVNCVDGKKLSVKIQPNTVEGTRVMFRGKGLQFNGKFGNMYGYVKIKMPKHLTDEEKDTLRKLKEHENFK